MSLIVTESATNNKPIELFTFARGADAWYFTSHDVDVTRNGISYRASLAARDGFRQSEESDDIITNVRVATRHPLGQLLMFSGLNDPEGPLYLTIALTDEADTEHWNVFFGEATDLSKFESHVELTVKPSQNSLKRPMLRVTGGPQCNHVLFDTGCGVNMLDYEVAVTIDQADGSNIIVISPAPGDSFITTARGGSYAAGFIQIDKNKWFIERNAAGTLKLMTPMSSSYQGMSAKAYPGCSRLYGICQAKFDNARNFGGFPKWPVTSPFENAD